MNKGDKCLKRTVPSLWLYSRVDREGEITCTSSLETIDLYRLQSFKNNWESAFESGISTTKKKSHEKRN